MIEASICSVLEEDATIAALVGTRVTEMPLPQDSALPAITYQVISPRVGAVPSRGPRVDDLVAVRIQIDCWASSSSSVAALSKAVADKLDGFAGLVGGVPVQGVFLVDGGGRAYEPETKLRRVRMDFRVHCRKGDA